MKQIKLYYREFRKISEYISLKLFCRYWFQRKVNKKQLNEN